MTKTQGGFMSNKSQYDPALTRLASIMQRLYEGETLTKDSLAEEFGVSEKTIQRDINTRLKSVPINLIRGVGWKLDDGYFNTKIAQRYDIYLQEENTMHQIELNIREAQEALENADAILITSGAGMGVDSGLPDFRGTDGFWRAYPPMKKLGLEFMDIANPKWFVTDPKLAWGFYGHRMHLYRKTEPHDGFRILKQLVEYKNNNYFIFTSNVDGQFQKAGFDENKIVECHGSIHHNQCLDRCSDDIWSNRDNQIVIDEATFLATPPLPKCRHCDNLARPNILMFGDYSFVGKREHEQDERLNSWIRQNLADNVKIAIIEIGAGQDIPTVRIFSETIAQQYDATLIRINPRDFDVPDGAISLPLGGQEGIEKIAL